jgi:hypothetical protein
MNFEQTLKGAHQRTLSYSMLELLACKLTAGQNGRTLWYIHL